MCSSLITKCINAVSLVHNLKTCSNTFQHIMLTCFHVQAVEHSCTDRQDKNITSPATICMYCTWYINLYTSQLWDQNENDNLRTIQKKTSVTQNFCYWCVMTYSNIRMSTYIIGYNWQVNLDFTWLSHAFAYTYIPISCHKGLSIKDICIEGGREGQAKCGQKQTRGREGFSESRRPHLYM